MYKKFIRNYKLLALIMVVCLSLAMAIVGGLMLKHEYLPYQVKPLLVLLVSTPCILFFLNDMDEREELKRQEKEKEKQQKGDGINE